MKNAVALIVASVVVCACSLDGVHPLRHIEHTGPTIASIAPAHDGGQDGHDGQGDDPASSPCFAPATFSFPDDALACHGDQLVRFDDQYGLFVGVVTCDAGDEMLRVYLSDDGQQFFPAADDAGHGQDHCELVNPDFTIGNEDSITSGDCANCSAETNLPLEGVTVWARGSFGEPFERIDHTPSWSYQTSQIACGINVVTCEEDLGGAVVAPPAASEGVPCDAGATATLRFDIPANDMALGDSDDSGPGFCTADVVFFDDLAATRTGTRFIYDAPDGTSVTTTSYVENGDSGGRCDSPHCGILTHADGHSDGAMCDVVAFCDPATHLATAVNYSW